MGLTPDEFWQLTFREFWLLLRGQVEKRRRSDYSLAWQTRYILAGFGGEKNVSHVMVFYRELQPGDTGRWEAYQKMLGREAADARELQQRMLDDPAVAAYAKSKGKTVHKPPGFD